MYALRHHFLPNQQHQDRTTQHNNKQHNNNDRTRLPSKMPAPKAVKLPPLTAEQLADGNVYSRVHDGTSYLYIWKKQPAICAYCGTTAISVAAIDKHLQKCDKLVSSERSAISETSERSERSDLIIFSSFSLPLERTGTRGRGTRPQSTDQFG